LASGNEIGDRSTAKDGPYWFTLQTLSKSGDSLPETVDATNVGLKVYVNAAGRPVIRKKALSD
jgi:hypothetical protein